MRCILSIRILTELSSGPGGTNMGRGDFGTRKNGQKYPKSAASVGKHIKKSGEDTTKAADAAIQALEDLERLGYDVSQFIAAIDNSSRKFKTPQTLKEAIMYRSMMRSMLNMTKSHVGWFAEERRHEPDSDEVVKIVDRLNAASDSIYP